MNIVIEKNRDRRITRSPQTCSFWIFKKSLNKRGRRSKLYAKEHAPFSLVRAGMSIPSVLAASQSASKGPLGPVSRTQKILDGQKVPGNGSMSKRETTKC